MSRSSSQRSRPTERSPQRVSTTVRSGCGISPTVRPLPDLAGHTAKVNGVAISPDAALLVTASDDKTLKVWDAASGAEVATLTTPAEVKSVTFSADGKLLASGHADNQIRVWNVPAAADTPAGDGTEEAKPVEPVRAITGHGGPVLALAANPAAANEIVSGSQDGTVRIWNLADGKQLFSQGLGGPVESVAISPDGSLIAGGGPNKLVRVWGRDNKLRAEIKGTPAEDAQVISLTDEQAVAKSQGGTGRRGVQGCREGRHQPRRGRQEGEGAEGSRRQGTGRSGKETSGRRGEGEGRGDRAGSQAGRRRPQEEEVGR